MFVSHLLLDTGYVRYQIGYNDGSAFTASRKTDVEAREKSEEVEAGWIGLWSLVCLFFFSSIFMPLPSLRFFFFFDFDRAQGVWNQSPKHAESDAAPV